MSYEIGRSYAGYEFLEVVSTSGDMVAYRVRNEAAQRFELLYVLTDTAQQNAQQVERFLREMRVRAHLVHPNIAAFCDATTLEGQLVMTTELVEGRTLAQHMESGPLAWRDAAGLVLQALAALECAHELHIVHRDISPDNIILTADGTLKLSNFGIAKPENSPQLTQAGAILGDFKYISPEQVRGGRELDARSDIYSLGALFYHMICGKPPFEARSRFEVMVAHVNQAPAPPSSVTRSIPGNLDAVILKALAKNPAERYQTAGEFAAAVRELPASEPVAVPAGAASKPARLQWVLMGGAGLAAVCIALWLAAK